MEHIVLMFLDIDLNEFDLAFIYLMLIYVPVETREVYVDNFRSLLAFLYLILRSDYFGRSSIFDIVDEFYRSL